MAKKDSNSNKYSDSDSSNSYPYVTTNKSGRRVRRHKICGFMIKTEFLDEPDYSEEDGDDDDNNNDDDDGTSSESVKSQTHGTPRGSSVNKQMKELTELHRL